MTQRFTEPKNLYVVNSAPASKSPGGTKWQEIAGCKIRYIYKYDERDCSYLVLAGTKETWLPEDWIQEIVGNDALRKAWRDEAFSEATRQMKVAKAFQNLLWREMMGRSLKLSVGTEVRIKEKADTIQRAFPNAWIEETHTLCYGLAGKIDVETREMGVDGEMYRGYRVAIPLSPDETIYVWFTGDDLEKP